MLFYLASEEVIPLLFDVIFNESPTKSLQVVMI